MENQGKIIAVLPPREGISARGTAWKVQEYVLETTHEQYPKKMVFEVFGADRIEQFGIQTGHEVSVAFDIDAREWNGRWFNSIRAYDVRLQSGAVPQTSNNTPQPAPSLAPAVNHGANDLLSQPAATTEAAANDTSDSLPF